jgi:urease subunit beta
MIPGELLAEPGELELNAGRRTITVVVPTPATGRSRSARTTTLPKPTPALASTAKPRAACGSNIAAGTAVRFEPGQTRTVELVALAGDRKVYGFRGLMQGAV